MPQMPEHKSTVSQRQQAKNIGRNVPLRVDKAGAMSVSQTRARRLQNLHDKTSYNIIPTPPSPPRSAGCSSYERSTATMSNSNSNSTTSSSPPAPQTPPRHNGNGRYPSLGRVPLHRRGTSHTYERLEDLLRDAGYKETRIFTPEGERERDRDSPSSATILAREPIKQTTVGAVVGFLAGLMPTRAPSFRMEEGDESIPPPPVKEYSPPTSPLAHKERGQRPNPTQQSLKTPLLHQTSSSSPRRSHLHTPLHQPQPDFSLSAQGDDRSRDMLHPQPSRAGAYLRHMASAPNMPRRPQASPVLQRRPTARRTVTLNHGVNDEELQAGSGATQQEQPPLPSSWFESVARAVMSGGSGAHVGGPRTLTAGGHNSNPNHNINGSLSNLTVNVNTAAAHVLRQTRSSLSQTTPRANRNNQNVAPAGSRLTHQALTDHTNRANPGKPNLMKLQVGGKAVISASAISRTKVTCRSAPVSRAGSPIAASFKGKAALTRGRDAKRGKSAKGERDALPSLARHRTEGDSFGWNASLTRTNNPREDDSPIAGSSSEEEEDDDGELDLARILVPPKRQNSIRSLRKHLHSQVQSHHGHFILPRGRSSAEASASRQTSARRWGDEDDAAVDEDFGSGWERHRVTDDSEAENEAQLHALTFAARSDSSMSSPGRRIPRQTRVALPGNWTTTSTS